jgi:hypothetical protein
MYDTFSDKRQTKTDAFRGRASNKDQECPKHPTAPHFTIFAVHIVQIFYVYWTCLKIYWPLILSSASPFHYMNEWILLLLSSILMVELKHFYALRGKNNSVRL